MSNTLKFAYTNDGVFNLSGAPYTGFYNVSTGTAYVGKYIQDTALINTDTIENAVILSDKFFNRIINQNITLTYNLSDFIFQPNEYINTNSINLKLEKAYVNYLDTYRACFYASSQLPYDFNLTAVVSATNNGYLPLWTSGGNNSTYLNPFSSFNSNITRNSKIALMTNVTPNTAGDCTLVIATSGCLFTYLINNSGTNNTFNLVFSSYRVETNNGQGYNQLVFENITSIAKSSNSFYVCDNGNRAVFSYDITSILNEDRALGKYFNLKNSITLEQGIFVSPKLIAASDNTVYVYDSTTGVITYLDTNFNIINNYSNDKYFALHPPVSLTYYKLTDSLFVLTQDYQLVVLDANANSTIYVFDNTQYAYNELPIKLVFSNTNSDVFYLLTNRGLYKKFISNNTLNIGSYTFSAAITGNLHGYNAGQDPYTYFYDMDTYDDINNLDNLLVYGYDQFINYNELTVFKSLLK